MIGIPLSIVFGGPLSGWLLGFEGHLGLHGWQWMFLCEGLPAVVWVSWCWAT
jgi:MFS family permease